MTIRSTIMQQITQVAEQQGKRLGALDDTVPLMASGLDSLCLAIIVANLDDELGIDPLSTITDAPYPVTIGDFIRLYENVATA